jgi:uncharacterized RDD family membrane protein YckC
VVVRRLLAELVDLVFATAVAVVVSAFVASVVRGPHLSWQMTYTNDVGLFLLSILCVLATLPFAVVWHRAEPTPGYGIAGLKLRDHSTHGVLSWGAAFARWIVLFAPITLLVYPIVVKTVFDPGPFLMLVEYPAWLDAMVVLPLVWYLLLGVSIVRSPDGRGWHDRVSGAIASRAAVSVRTNSA